MFKYTLYIATFCLILISCDGKENYKITIDKEVNSINSIDSKKKFLSKIYEDGQGINTQINTLEKAFFKNRKKLIVLRRKRDCLVHINRYRIKSYLNRFPYPQDSIFDDKEKLAIYYGVCLDINRKEQLKYLDLFENLYHHGIITDYNYLSYLSKIYYLEHLHFFSFDKRHSIKEMINDITPSIKKINNG